MYYDFGLETNKSYTSLSTHKTWNIVRTSLGLDSVNELVNSKVWLCLRCKFKWSAKFLKPIEANPLN